MQPPEHRTRVQGPGATPPLVANGRNHANGESAFAIPFRDTTRGSKPDKPNSHHLRNTAATLSLAAGVPAEVVSGMPGHASVALTLDVYSLVLPHSQEEAVPRMAARLKGENGVELPEQAVSPQTANRHTAGTRRKTNKSQAVM